MARVATLLHVTSTNLFAQDKACQHLGIVLAEVSPGRAIARMLVTGEMLNGHGIAHGGYLFLLADAAFAYACDGPLALAHSAQVTFVSPVHADEWLEASAVQRKKYGRHGIYDVTVTRANGDVVAEFRGHSVHMEGLKWTAS